MVYGHSKGIKGLQLAKRSILLSVDWFKVSCWSSFCVSPYLFGGFKNEGSAQSCRARLLIASGCIMPLLSTQLEYCSLSKNFSIHTCSSLVHNVTIIFRANRCFIWLANILCYVSDFLFDTYTFIKRETYCKRHIMVIVKCFKF